MRRSIVLLLLAALASAQEGGAGAVAAKPAELERLLIARLAFEARLKLGDMLRGEGKRKEALAAYADALARFEAELGPPAEIVVEEVVGIGRAARPRVEGPVEAGLKWLADHQEVDGDGRWDADQYDRHDPADDKCDGVGGALFDPAVTGLSILAFLGAGYTDRGGAAENPYARNVRQGLRFLLSVQDAEGCFGPRAGTHFIYNHAIATLAMCEAYAMTRNPGYREPALSGIAFLLKAQNVGSGWRYGLRPGDSDTSVTAWCVAALRSSAFAFGDPAKPGDPVVPAEAFTGALAWIDSVTDKESGRVGYKKGMAGVARPEALVKAFPPERSEAMTAAGIATRIFCGEDPRTTEAIRKGAKLCLDLPPAWDREKGTIDMYYWYWGTIALFQAGGEEWRGWSAKMKEILRNQHAAGSGSRTGSWDPVDPWGQDCGGRIYSTALMTMSFEVYHRFDRAFGAR